MCDPELMGTVRVGASSWANPTLVRDSNFYPATIRTPAERLRFYATQFPIVEADSTYYRLPSEQMIAAWPDRTPSDFIFNVKAFRAFTLHPTPPGALPRDLRSALPEATALKANLYWHDLPKELQENLWDRFRRAPQPLSTARKLGAILVQFPPWVHPTNDNKQHLRGVRQALPVYRVAVEFRDISWVTSTNLERTMQFLTRNNLTYVCVDEPQVGRLLPPLIRVTTRELAVVRLHGRNADGWKRRGETTTERSRYLYQEDELLEWVPRVEELARTAAETHVIFNNSFADYAIRNARQFTEMLAREGLGVMRQSG
jgi:uncharacterized protein YecE (DUF72 family)